VRRSRSRFKKAGADKQQALSTLHFVLMQLTKLLAPFAPFIADSLYRELVPGKVSVHLTDWPVVDKKTINEKLLKQMGVVRQAVELGHSLRKEHGFRVRQPLSQFVIKEAEFDQTFLDILKEEMNVQEVVAVTRMPSGQEFAAKEYGGVQVALDTTVTDELKELGVIRELVRQVNAMRKDASLTINDIIMVYYDIADKVLTGILVHYKTVICRDTLAVDCLRGVPDNVDLKKLLNISGKKATLAIKKR
jgi:isoleucyl-tRNA synthetase